MKEKVWGEAHRREAEPRTFELAAEQIRAGEYDGDKFVELTENAQREDWWRSALAEMGFDAARIDREVRRVRALAEGRLVRETRWRAGNNMLCDSAELAESMPGALGKRPCRVTRIRRAPR